MSWAPKDPDATDFYYVVWCSEDGTNDGTSSDTGELQGATISTSTWTVPDGITKNSDNKNSVTLRGVTYAANTVATIELTGGTANTDYDILNRIVTSDGRTLDKTNTLMVRAL
jgi:hypothetical protein